MKKLLITQSNYIPWKGYFDGINTVDTFVLYDDMQYTRRDWRNRNQIKTPQGKIWLTIPVEVKGKYFQKIMDTKISDKHWATEHWNLIKINYGKSAFFTEYKDFFEPLYMNLKTDYLSEVNYIFLKAICDLLNIKTAFKWSSQYQLQEERTERLVDICKIENATDYYSGPSAKAYMNEERFLTNNIKIHYFDNTGYPEYHQQFGVFDHAVSIMDLIFNEGPKAKNFMKSFQSIANA